MAVPLALAAIVLLGPGAAFAQLAPRDAVTARVNGYRETGAAFKSINDQIKADALVRVMLRASARRIMQTSREQYGWFPAGSGAEAGLKTKARPVIWSDAAGFKALQDRFQQQAGLFAQAVDGGDAGKIKAQARALGDACGACHNKFREKD